MLLKWCANKSPCYGLCILYGGLDLLRPLLLKGFLYNFLRIEYYVGPTICKIESVISYILQEPVLGSNLWPHSHKATVLLLRQSSPSIHSNLLKKNLYFSCDAINQTNSNRVGFEWAWHSITVFFLFLSKSCIFTILQIREVLNCSVVLMHMNWLVYLEFYFCINLPGVSIWVQINNLHELWLQSSVSLLTWRRSRLTVTSHSCNYPSEF